MESTTTVRKEDGSSFIWRCRELALKSLLTRERRSPLGEAYLFWADFVHPAAAFDFTAAPAADPFSEDVGSTVALAPVFRVDCSGENPFDFRIGQPPAGGPDIALRDLGPDCVRRILAQDLNYVKGSRQPLYQHVHQQIDGAEQDCYRLLLPVLGHLHEVSEVYGFCRPVKEVQLSKARRKRSAKTIQDR